MLIVDKETFGPEVLEAQGYVLVDYYSDGCVPCQALLPELEVIAEKHADKAKFVKLNTSKARRMAIKQKVLGLPTITLYKDGAKVAELTKDDATAKNIENMLVENIK